VTDTTVVNMRNSAYDVAIDRTSPFGNPFHLGKDGDRTTVLAKYREYFLERVEKDADFKRKVLALRGLRLGCWCSPLLCHGMIIAEWLEATPV
jgi:hypothetical protein